MEEKIDGISLELGLEENISDYLKLSELQKELEELRIELDIALNEWETLSDQLETLKNPQN